MYLQSIHSSHKCFTDTQKIQVFALMYEITGICAEDAQECDSLIYTVAQDLLWVSMLQRDIFWSSVLFHLFKTSMLTLMCCFSSHPHLLLLFFRRKILLFSDSWFKAIDPISNTGQGDQWISQKRFSMRKPSYHTSYFTGCVLWPKWAVGELRI